MTTCARSGYLVDGTSALPTDPTDVHVDGLPVVGCSHLRCHACGAIVRNALGLGVRSPDAPVDAVALYETADLATSPALQPTVPTFRLYLCRCRRWLETSQHALDEPDRDLLTDPDMPWSCDGHPRIVLPAEIDGVSVRSKAELGPLAGRALRGWTPPGARPSDTVRSVWLVRLHARLQPADATAVVDAAIATLTDADPRTRARAIAFFDRVPDEAGLTYVASLLDGDRRLVTGVVDAEAAVPGETLEQSVWRALGPLVERSPRVRDLARADARAAGKGSRALYDVLCRRDSTWLATHVEEIARAATDRGESLIASFARLPATLDVTALRDRVRLALAASTTPQEPRDQAIARAVSELAERIQREAPRTGSAAKIQQEMPSLGAGAAVELEFRGDFGARYLDLVVTTASGNVRDRVLEGTHEQVLALLRAPGTPAQLAQRSTRLAAEAGSAVDSSRG